MNTRIFFLLLSFCFITNASAQSLEEKITKRRPYGLDVPANAGDLLLQLYYERSFDSIGAALSLLKKHSAEHPVEEFYLITLFHIQQSTFSIIEVSDSTHFRLLIYPGYIGGGGNYKYDNWNFGYSDDWKAQLQWLVREWAADLLYSKRRLSDNEFFVCSTLAGNYSRPVKVLRAQKEKHPELYALLLESYKEERSAKRTVGSMMVGVWMPTGNLKVLGTHPSLGGLFGPRNKRSAFSLTFQVRFFKSGNFYSVQREDSLYKANRYTSFYIGLGYTRYFLYSTQVEAGIVGGVGWDGLNATYTINSLNLNAGFRFNYFFNSRFSIGIMPKYNAIWYNNRGGTSLQGQPISIDLLFGR